MPSKNRSKRKLPAFVTEQSFYKRRRLSNSTNYGDSNWNGVGSDTRRIFAGAQFLAFIKEINIVISPEVGEDPSEEGHPHDVESTTNSKQNTISLGDASKGSNNKTPYDEHPLHRVKSAKVNENVSSKEETSSYLEGDDQFEMEMIRSCEKTERAFAKRNAQQKKIIAKGKQELEDKREKEEISDRGFALLVKFLGQMHGVPNPHLYGTGRESKMRMHFGKFKGRPLHDLPFGYLQWMREKNVLSNKPLKFKKEMQRIYPGIFGK